VAYGRFDLDWLISTATIGARDDGELVVGFDVRKAPRVIEQLIVARRALYDTVYEHKTVKAAEGMVGLLLRRLRDVVQEKGWLFQDDALFAPYKDLMAGHALSPEQVLGLDDYSLWVLMTYVSESSGDATARDLARRIVHRDLFKQVPVEGHRLDEYLGLHGRERLYPIVERHCDGEPEYYIHVEYSELMTLGTDSAREVYFVDTTGSGVGHASVAREHPEIQHLFSPEAIRYRLFAPAPAVPDLIDALGA
jgi:HD superfamily phosphohydrolase